MHKLLKSEDKQINPSNVDYIFAHFDQTAIIASLALENISKHSTHPLPAYVGHSKGDLCSDLAEVLDLCCLNIENALRDGVCRCACAIGSKQDQRARKHCELTVDNVFAGQERLHYETRYDR